MRCFEAPSRRFPGSRKRGLPPVEHQNGGGSAPSTFSRELKRRGQPPVGAKGSAPWGFEGTVDPWNST